MRSELWIRCQRERTMEVMEAFQRYTKSGSLREIDSIELEELKLADVRLGNRDTEASFRIALRNRILELEAKNEKRYQSWVRAVGYIAAFALGVISTLVVNWLTKWA
ncbi:MAG: hypothetical protein L0Z68_02190 [Gammaproteobacteria bacterium]|nr:hypothetical protein [Gammaproteobacteria bacterium]